MHLCGTVKLLLRASCLRIGRDKLVGCAQLLQVIGFEVEGGVLGCGDSKRSVKLNDEKIGSMQVYVSMQQ